ncbi:unnamed protein product, partial [Protopolystoma xenopodis]
MFEMVSHFNVPSNTRPYSNFISLTVFASDPAPSKSPQTPATPIVPSDYQPLVGE